MNIEVIKANIAELKSEESKTPKLTFPFNTKVYEAMLTEDPQLFSELSQKTEGQLESVYVRLMNLNTLYTAMNFGIRYPINRDVAITGLTQLIFAIEILLRKI